MKIKKIALICITSFSLFVCNSAFSATEAQSSKSASASKSALSYEQIKMAAESGDADAQYALGYMFYYGKGGASKDTNLAKTWIGKAAAQKQPQAVKAIALMNAKQGQSADNKIASSQNTSINNQQETSKTNPQEDANRHSAVVEKEKMTLVDMRQKQMEEKIAEEETNSASSLSDNAVYTLQLLGAYNKEQIKKLARDHHLTKAKMYKTSFKDKDWYVLIYGQYKTKSEADLAAKRIENEIALKPWIKPLASIKHYKLTAAL